MPGRRVRVGRAAGRRVARARTRAGRRAPGVVDEPAGSLELLHRPVAGHLLDRRPSCPGTVGGRGDPADRRLGRLERLARSSPAGRPRAWHRSATTLGRVPPAITPTLTVTPGQRPFSAWRSRRTMRPPRGSRCGPSRARRRRARPGRATVDPGVEDPLARGHDVAVGPGALEDEADVARRRRARGCAGSSVGEPISSSGLATNDEPLERQRPPSSARRLRARAGRAAHRGRPAGRTSCRSRPGRRRRPSSIRNGRSAAVPG